MQTRQVNVLRWTIISHKPFDAVVAAVEAAIGRPNMGEFTAKMAAAQTYDAIARTRATAYFATEKDPK